MRVAVIGGGGGGGLGVSGGGAGCAASFIHKAMAIEYVIGRGGSFGPTGASRGEDTVASFQDRYLVGSGGDAKNGGAPYPLGGKGIGGDLNFIGGSGGPQLGGGGAAGPSGNGGGYGMLHEWLSTSWGVGGGKAGDDQAYGGQGPGEITVTTNQVFGYPGYFQNRSSPFSISRLNYRSPGMGGGGQATGAKGGDGGMVVEWFIKD
ncbi:hypothetical protein [Comamonas aquatica]|uniref:hypothetical protein n=1 Tax=Comamonas aquatica TaxID=225991 RepID=UPI001EF18DB1|nr:hypothetical protein [Comamonas aquatica]